MEAWKHPATIIASLALFIALGGGAALASGLISGKQIVNHSIPEKKLTAAAIKALRGMRGPQGPKGAPGSQGVKGDTGATGPIGPSNAYFKHAASATVSVSVPAGAYVISGQGVFGPIDTSQNASGYCLLEVNGSQVSTASGIALAYVPGPGLGSSVSPDSGVAHLSAAGTVTNACVSGINTNLTDNAVTAIKVGTVSP